MSLTFAQTQVLEAVVKEAEAQVSIDHDNIDIRTYDITKRIDWAKRTPGVRISGRRQSVDQTCATLRGLGLLFRHHYASYTPTPAAWEALGADAPAWAHRVDQWGCIDDELDANGPSIDRITAIAVELAEEHYHYSNKQRPNRLRNLLADTIKKEQL